MLPRWDSTVFSDSCSAPISRLVCASAISLRTSCSRGLSGSRGPAEPSVSHAHQRALRCAGQERLAPQDGTGGVDELLARPCLST